jgi:phosphate transport system substrate-binding protein
VGQLRSTLGASTRRGSLTLVLAGTVALTGCAAVNERGGVATGGALAGTVNGAGSSAQQAAMQAWTAGFSTEQPGVTVNYDPVGSGGGREQFLAGGVTFAGSDAPLDDEELEQAAERCGDAGVFELPNYISAIAVVFNVQGVAELNLSPSVVAGIFAGAVTRWNDPAVAADNPGVALPDLAITPVHRSDKSGTTENFTEYLAAAGGQAWSYEPDGEWPVDGGEAATGTSGVIAAVGGGNGTIGYADASQAGDLGVARIKVGQEFVAPTAEGAAAVVEGSPLQPGRGKYDFAIEIERTTTDPAEYPLVLVSYQIGCLAYPSQEEAGALAEFLDHVISEQGQLAAAETAGSAPITNTLRGQAMTAIDAITVQG